MQYNAFKAKTENEVEKKEDRAKEWEHYDAKVFKFIVSKTVLHWIKTARWLKVKVCECDTRKLLQFPVKEKKTL